jgi:AcrR family transcriptional regulator
MMVALKMPKRDKAAKIEKILKTTRKMIEEKGYFKTTTNHIAGAANVSVGLVYKYFPGGKAEIVRAIAHQGYSTVMDTVIVKDLDEKHLEKTLEELLRKYIKEHQEMVSLVTAMEIAFLSDPTLAEDYSDLIQTELNPGPMILSKLFGSDVNSNPKILKLSQTILHTIDSLVHRHICQVRIFENDNQLVEYLKNLVLSLVEHYKTDLQ